MGWCTPWSSTPAAPSATATGGSPPTTSPARSAPTRSPGRPPPAVDTVATNVITFGGRTLALGPGALAYELDDQLATVGRVDLAGHGRGIGAHPQVDPLTGALHLVSYGDEPAHHIVSPSSQTRITSPVPDAPGPLHDLLLTRERFVLLGEGFVGIADRAGQATPRWAARRPPRRRSPPTTPAAVAVLTASRALRAMDLRRRRRPPRRPRRHTPALRHHQPARVSAPTYVWTVAAVGGTEVYRHDLRTGDRTAHDLGPGRHPGELTFVPDPTRRHREDGGWLIGFVHDDDRNEADLIVLDAAAIDRPPVATVRDPSTHPLRAPRHVDPVPPNTDPHRRNNAVENLQLTCRRNSPARRKLARGTRRGGRSASRGRRSGIRRCWTDGVAVA